MTASAMRDLAPDIVRQRLLIEGLYARDFTRDYFAATDIGSRGF